MSGAGQHTRDISSESDARTIFGFWLYLMTDCILFATLFATYAVLNQNTNGGPAAKELFDLRAALAETIILLTSSLTCGFAFLSSKSKDKLRALIWFGVTFVLGAAFLHLEIQEFTHLVQTGNSWQRSAFLSAFFTLVGTHGLHIASGLLWMLVMMAQILSFGFTASVIRRITCLVLFWHFLDLIWVFIYTIVYLMGVA